MEIASKVHRGFSLVELLIAMTIGVSMLTALVSIYASTARTNADVIRYTRLEEELQAVMSLMTRELRRAGFTPEARNPIHYVNVDPVTGLPIVWSNPFFYDGAIQRFGLFNVATGAAVPAGAAADCVLFNYDTNGDGILQNTENFGFRLINGFVEVRQNAPSACNVAANWVRLSTPGITVTQLGITENATALVGASATATVSSIDLQITARLDADATVQRTVESRIRMRNERLN